MGLDKNIRQVIGGIGLESSRASPQADELDFNRLLNTAWRFKWLMAACVALGLAGAWLHLQRVTPLYTAEARVLWEVDEQNISGLEGVASGLTSDWMLLGSQIEIILSGRLLGRVVDELDAASDPAFNPALRPPEGWTRWLSPSAWISGLVGLAGGGGPAEPAPEPTPEELREQLIATLRGAIEPDWLENTYVLNIRATTIDPDASARLANEVARLYILDQLETKFDTTRQATDWLTERVSDLRIELEEAESRLEAFTSSTTLISEATLSGLSRQLKELRERGIELAAEADQSAAERAALEEAWAERDYAAVAQRSGDPALARLASEIAATPGAAERETLAERFEQGYRRALQRLANQRQRTLAQRDTVERSVAEQEQRIDEQSAALVEQRQLTREADASRLIYEFFLGRLKEISVQEGIQQPDARVLTGARAPSSPSYPSKATMMLAGGALGMLLGLFGTVLIERRRTGFRSVEDLEARTGQMVIGTLPQAPVSRRDKLLGYLSDKPTSALAEAVRNLRTSILLANVDEPPQVIMSTSSLPAEGKTTCCIALAQMSQAMGKRVLLIECDVRRRTFHDYFDFDDEAGLLSVLSGSRRIEEVVRYDEQSGLYVLPGEESSVNASDIFTSQRFATFIAEMRRSFDFIFIDTPPVLAVPDARVIAKFADAVIFVVRWNRTPRDIVQEGLRQFSQVNVKIAGLVLSRINMRQLARYGRGYGHYSEASKYYRN